jgi:nucleotide-binding universal stress UspA family protein
MYKRVLVPVDGSAASNLALLEAIKLVKAMPGKLRLVHVVDEFVMDGFTAGLYYEALVEALRAGGRKTLEESVAVVRQHALEPESVLLETFGHGVAQQVVKQAKDWPADAIVMGTHGRRGIRRLVMGSDAETVLRIAPVPVLLVRESQNA